MTVARLTCFQKTPAQPQQIVGNVRRKRNLPSGCVPSNGSNVRWRNTRVQTITGTKLGWRVKSDDPHPKR